MSFPETGRQAAHVLLDAVVASDLPASSGAADLAFQRLTEIDAYTISIVDTATEIDVQVDLSDVLGAALITIEHLARSLAEAQQRSIEAVIAETREYLDR